MEFGERLVLEGGPVDAIDAAFRAAAIPPTPVTDTPAAPVAEPAEATPVADTKGAEPEKKEAPKEATPETQDKQTPEDLAKAIAEKGLAGLDDAKLDPELAEKKKAMQKHFDKRNADVNAYEKQLQAQVNAAKELAERYDTQLKRIQEEYPTSEAKADPILQQQQAQLNQATYELNRMNALSTLRAIVPESNGQLPPSEIVNELASQFPKLQKLATINNGEFLDVVATGLTLLAQNSPENRQKAVYAEAMKLATSKDFIEKHIFPVLKEMEKASAAKAKPLSKAGHPAPPAAKVPDADWTTGQRINLGDAFLNAAGLAAQGSGED